MTSGFTHAVIKYDPNLSDEAFNIGIVVHDHSTNLVYWKYTKNVDYIKKMTIGAPHHVGVSYFIDMAFKDRDKVEKHEEHDYLEKLAKKERGIYTREWIEVKGGGVAGYQTAEEYVDWIYRYCVNMDQTALQHEGKEVFSYNCKHQYGTDSGTECKICTEKDSMKQVHRYCSECINNHKEWHKKND